MTDEYRQAKGGSLTAYVADFASRTCCDDIPEDVFQLGKKNVLDGLACALSGFKSSGSLLIRKYLKGIIGDFGISGTTVIGTTMRLPSRFSALANGAAMHADDFDDTFYAEVGRFQAVHPTSPVLPAVLSAGEAAGRSGRDVLTAYHVGVEVACRIFDASHVNHILDGFHATATCGMIGAAAGVANLYGLNADSTRRTLAIAASQACGFQANFGTMMKPMHAGRSAECGIIAADLGRIGFTASPVILESPKGVYQAEGGGYVEERLLGKLGNPWSFMDRGISLKPWPTGGLGHPAMTITQQLVADNDVKTDQVAGLRVKTSQNIHSTLFHHRPKTALEAKFSLEFSLAALLLQRKLGLGDFTEDFVAHPRLQELISKIDYGTFSAEEGKELGCTNVTAFIDIDLKDGRTFSGRDDYGKGSKINPMSEEDVADKFRDCAAFADWPERKTEETIAFVRQFEELKDLRALTACLTGTEE